MRIRRFIHLLLFFLAIALFWQVVETWSRPHPVPASPDAARPPEEAGAPRFAPTPAPAVVKQLAQVIADKDLFSPSRSRAVAEPPPEAAPVPPPVHLKLVGIILFPGQEEAFFSDSSQGGKVVRLRKGDTLGPYRLVQIAPLQATLTLGQDGEEVSLPLVVIDSSAAAKAPRLIPPLAQAASQTARVQQARAVAATADGGALTDETQAIRQNIQQLQRRLRQIRRQAARQKAGNQENEPQDEPPAAEEEEAGEEESEG